MPNGHILACPTLQGEGACTCASESKHYQGLAGYSLLAFVIDLTGALFGSIGLLADMFHVGFDLAENLLSVWISRRARWSLNEEAIRRWGGVVSASLILLLSLWILHEAIDHLSHPYTINLWWAIPLAIAGLCINVRQFVVHEAAPDEHRNTTHHWQWLHIVVDTLGSVFAIVGLLLSLVGVPNADAYAALMIVLLIWGRVLFLLIPRHSDISGHSHHHH